MSAVSLMASGNHGSGRLSSVTDAAAFNTMRLVLDCTVATIPAGQPRLSPPTLEVSVETSPVATDGATWRELARFTPVRAVGQQTKTIVGFDRYVRVAYEARCFAAMIDRVQQDPAFTWSLEGEGT